LARAYSSSMSDTESNVSSERVGFIGSTVRVPDLHMKTRRGPRLKPQFGISHCVKLWKKDPVPAVVRTLPNATDDARDANCSWSRPQSLQPDVPVRNAIRGDLAVWTNMILSGGAKPHGSETRRVPIGCVHFIGATVGIPHLHVEAGRS